MPAAIARGVSPIAKAQTHSIDHIDEPITIDLAKISLRNFRRRFLLKTNRPAIEYVQNTKVDFARKLLEQRVLPLTPLST
ncbi:hypothetical protein GCM10009425_29140 [Pseudomonas asuensis]|uniref:Uncharacterized protein n=1 Tax=Pseudomonas asuensis TaxID=1825787 RepID=A0ABQ2GXB3_9PSED|nr:hypothetical protein GCM10009425_29140 [Pseudomonas asuensis]